MAPQPPIPARQPRPRPGVSLQNLLLGLGTTLIAVAAVVFAAVNWRGIGATVQGLILVALTVLASLVTVATARRRMPATAEAVGLVAVLLALADVHALRVGLAAQVDAAVLWAGALAVVAGSGWALGAATGVRSTRMAASILGQLSLPVLLVGLDADATVSGLALLSQVAVIAVAAVRAERAPRAARLLASLGAAGTWVVVVAAALVLAPFVHGADRIHAALVLAAATAVAALVAWLRADDEAIRPVALAAASGVGLAAATATLTTLFPNDRAWPAFALVAAAVVAVGTRVEPRWGRVPAGVATVAAVLSATPIVESVLVALGAAARVWPEAWHVAAQRSATSLVPDAAAVVGPGTLALHLGALVGLLVAGTPVLGRRWTVRGGVVTALMAVAVAPLVLPLTLAGAVLVGVGALALCVGAGLLAGPIVERMGGNRARFTRGAALSAAATTMVAGAWCPTAPWLTLTAVGASAMAALAFVFLARVRRDIDLAVGAATAAAAGLAVEAGFALAAAGRSGEVAVVLTGVVALAIGVAVAQLLDPQARRRDVDGAISMGVEVVTWLVHGGVLALVAGSAGSDGSVGLRLTLAAGALAAGLHAVRPGRRLLAWLAAAEGLLLTWTQLGDLGVRLPEAYTLPLAVALLGAGLVGERRAARDGEAVGSWVTVGPALVVGFVPTVVVGLSEPGLVRPLLGLVAGALVLAGGALAGRRAAVDVGVAVVALLGLRQLAPVVGELPNWATLGATGTLLVVVGATFEQRRRDLRDVRIRYRQLR